MQYEPSQMWKVIIIDDEPMLRELLEEMIGDLGYRTISYDNAFAALAALSTKLKIEFEDGIDSKQNFDIIVCDVKMPGMSGIEFYDKLRIMNPNLAARIVFVTGNRHDMAVQDFFDQSGSLWLEKPFRRSELVSVLENLRRRISVAI